MDSRIHHGDGVEFMKNQDDNTCKSVMTDIPYGVVNREDNGLRSLDKDDADEMTFDIDTAIREMKRISTDSIYIFCAQQQSSYVMRQLEELSTRLLIWKKTNPSPMNCQYLYLNDIECCVYAKHPSGEFNNHYQSCVIENKAGSSKNHPTEKPVDLFETLVSDATSEGDTIVDPFCGSGSSIVAADKHDRVGVGVDCNKEYVEYARSRLNNE